MNGDTELPDLDFLVKVMRLKEEPRTGWMKHGIQYPESVAGHTFGAAFLTFLLGRGRDDRDRAVRMALVHDIQEEITGDIPSGELSDDEQREKKDVEREAITELLSLAGTDTDELRALWDEYNDRESGTARFVKDVEQLDMALQAYIYASGDRDTANKHFRRKYGDLAEFFDHAEAHIADDRIRAMVTELRDRLDG